jgi:uroporphyrinogen III methyltransferase/synthase
VSGPLSGKTIALLRAQGQGGDLARGFDELGARLLEVPMIAIAPPEDPRPLRAAIEALATFEWIALTSPNAANAFADALEAARAAAPPRIASVGPGTTRALAERGLAVALEAEASLQEGLARALVAAGVAGRRVLVPQADRAREALEQALEAAGASVTAVVAYRTVEGAGDPRVLLVAL